MLNACCNCTHNCLKLKVLVPDNHTIMEYMHRTGNFQSDIAAIIKEKQGQYTVWLRSEGDREPVTFEMLHICDLRIAMDEKQAKCSCFKESGKMKQITSIIFSKQSIPMVAMTH